MAITRWDPFRDVLALQNRMNSLFSGTTNRTGERRCPRDHGLFRAPRSTFTRTSYKIVLKLEVPGMKRKRPRYPRSKTTLLTVKGERKFEKEEKEENFHRIERRYGTFYRSFTVPNYRQRREHLKASYEGLVCPRIELEKSR